MKKAQKKNPAISCQTTPNLAKSCQTMPPEESQPEPGAIDTKRGATKTGGAKRGDTKRDETKPGEPYDSELKPGEPKPDEPHPGDLKPNQQRALLALLESPSVAAAARESGIGERTIHRWLHEDPDFRDELREKRRQRLEHAATRLQSTASQAVQAIVDLIASKDHIETGRAALVRTALDFAFRAGAYTDLADRLDALEEATKDNPPKEPEPIFDRSLLDDEESEAA
jgi:hypothetical protein